ncbi:hypothetical protein FS749_011377 [Ceratobasidium sp. UAMH 11750]|nr:hypothetical protein FS749_011377 [Ceratobasidium sp. UAMH 11750]
MAHDDGGGSHDTDGASHDDKDAPDVAAACMRVIDAIGGDRAGSLPVAVQWLFRRDLDQIG